jgi:DNA-binding NarL/FixJ family response regulator
VPAEPLRVAVVSQHELTGAGLAHLIGHDADRAVVMSSLNASSTALPDVIVYALSGAEGDLEELRHLVSCGCPVIVLQSSTRPHTTETVLALGATQVVAMDVAGTDLIEIVERAAAGQRVSRASDRRATRDRARGPSGLTEREVAVLELIATGLSNDEIATTLFITINTVKSYVRTAYKRIGVDTRSQAVIWALENGLGPVAVSRAHGSRWPAVAGPAA